MSLWPALIVPPIAFLTALSAAYALVPWACESQRHFPLHLVAMVCLAVCAGGVLLAWRDWRSAGAEEPDDGADDIVHIRFVSVLGLLLSALMVLSTLTLWMTIVIIPPCVS
jgi:hypothetical protein